MAKYNRDFLVLYLKDLYALHLAENKLRKQHDKLVGRANKLERGVEYATPPREPSYSDNGMGIFLIVTGAVTVVLSFVMSAFNINVLGLLFLFGGIFEIVMGLITNNTTNKENDKKREEYGKQRMEYNRIQRQNLEVKNKYLPETTAGLKQCKSAIQDVSATLSRAYSANIIPGQYRNLYAIAYLYEYFCYSQEDNLSIALNTFVLEQIKERLDRIIENQSEIILNQYRIISQNQEAMEQREQQHAMLCEKLTRIEASNEERNTYLEMINCNTATTAYFTAADYFRKLR